MDYIRKLCSLFWKFRIKTMSKDHFIEYLRNLGVNVGKNCDIAKDVVFGNEPWLVKIGSNTRITKNVQFITHDGGVWTLRKLGYVGPDDVYYGNIVVGDNCNISWNVVIMPGVRIGNNCVVGAGAIVTKNIPDNSVAVGIPAHVVESIEKYAEKKVDACVPTMKMTDDEKKNYLLKYRPELFDFERKIT